MPVQTRQSNDFLGKVLLFRQIRLGTSSVDYCDLSMQNTLLSNVPNITSTFCCWISKGSISFKFSKPFLSMGKNQPENSNNENSRKEWILRGEIIPIHQTFLGQASRQFVNNLKKKQQKQSSNGECPLRSHWRV